MPKPFPLLSPSIAAQIATRQATTSSLSVVNIPYLDGDDEVVPWRTKLPRIKKKVLYPFAGVKSECVHKDDYFPVNLIEPDLERGPWIAGGAALAWYNKQAVGTGDIDVFFKNQYQFNRCLTFLESADLDLTCVYKSDNALTFRLQIWPEIKIDWRDGNVVVPVSSPKEWRIQLIKRFFTSYQDVLDNFDITVCKVATDGGRFELGEDTAKHIRDKELVFSKPNANCVKRLLKYWAYGYEPTNETLDMIYSYEGAEIRSGADEDYNNAF